MAVLVILVVILLLISVGLGVAYSLTVGKKRDLRDVQRGLEMVSLLIHLPPLSDDTNVGGRDIRDVVDETISKAQIIYNIIASTAEKNKQSKMYGQEHLGFEIVGVKGFVYFYASVPVSIVDVVKQAIVSAYPSAALENAPEPNFFNEVGGASAVFGGEMALKEPFAFPIATYQELKRDAFQSVLGALASLDKEDGVGIQILFRPAHDSWRKVAAEIASKKRKGKYNNKSGLQQVTPIMKQVVTALSKPPEDKKDSSPSDDLSTIDRSIVEAIEDKTRHPGFETNIRLVVSSNVSGRAQALLQNLVASFALFDAPGKNGFKFVASSNNEQLVSDYLLRTFKKSQNKMVLNAVELATVFHFPDQNKVPTSQLTRQESKQVDGPRNIPEEGMLMGYNVFRGAKKPIRLALQDRQRHMYVVGQTGTGKSTYLENLALQDMLKGNGFAFVDPHGDTAEKLLSMVPKERTEDVIYFSPADMDFPMGLNLFEFNNADQKDFLIQEALNMLYKLYDPQHQGIMGPRYEHLFRMAALTVMADPAGGTFIDIPKLFRDPTYVKQKLKYVKDQTVIEFWEKEMPQSQRSNEFGEVVSWFVSKFGAFLSNEMMRNIIGQTKSAFDLRDIMDNKKILLVNLSKGRTGELNSKLLGMIFVMKFQAAAMSRASIPEDDRVDFSLYVDEFQNFSTDSFATIMSEARKYHLNLIVANQFTTQLTEEIRDAVFGNMGTIVSFRVGQNDVDSLSKYFQPTFDGDDLLRVPNYNTIIRTLINGVPTQPFSMATLPPLGNPNSHLANALKQLSAAKYGKPRKQVEETIFARMKTLTPPPAAAKPFGQPASAGQSPSPWSPQGPSQAAKPVPPTAAKPDAAPASFLDEWLQKRQKPAPAHVVAPPVPAPAPAPTPPQPTPVTAKPQGVVPPQPQGHPAQVPKPTASRPPGVQGAPPISHVTTNPHLPPKPAHKAPHEAERHGERVIQPPKHPSGSHIDIAELAKEMAAKEAGQAVTDQKAPPAPVKPVEPEEVELPLPKPKYNPPKTPTEPAEDDTILIDADGNLVHREEDKPAADSQS